MLESQTTKIGERILNILLSPHKSQPYLNILTLLSVLCMTMENTGFLSGHETQIVLVWGSYRGTECGICLLPRHS